MLVSETVLDVCVVRVDTVWTSVSVLVQVDVAGWVVVSVVVNSVIVRVAM